MASNGNFGTWNPLADYSSGTTFSNGNCTTAISQQNQYRACLGPAIPDSGKWYIEFFIDNQSAGFPSLMGVLDGTINSSLSSSNYLSNAGSFHIEPMSGKLYSESTTGTSYTGNSGSPSAVGDADAKVGIAIDRDNNKLWFAVNNTWINVGSGVGDPANDSNPAVSSIEENLSISHGIRQATGTSKVVINCGQDSTFGGLATAGGNADDNGFGDFFYAPPTGFLALCSANLPISDDIDPAQTDDDYPQKQFNTVTYTGNGTTVNVTGAGFQPDLVWIKMRSPHAYNHMLFDTNRGVTKHISTDRTNSEFTTSNSLTSFDSDGFTYGSELSGNDSGDSFVAWMWKCNGGTTASNTDGSITTTVQANTAAGFSIITYTGTGAVATIGHGLTEAPTFIMCKNRDDADYWGLYHISIGATHYGTLPSTSTPTANSDFWNDTAPTSSVITLGNQNRVNGSGDSIVAYAWHNVEGFQKFGNYTGNGNADGAFIYTGFRPRLIVIKGADVADSWFVLDTARNTFNPLDNFLRWEATDTEATHANVVCDAYSNGFKLRSSSNAMNGSGNTYIYMVWGDVPFKYNNTF